MCTTYTGVGGCKYTDAQISLSRALMQSRDSAPVPRLEGRRQLWGGVTARGAARRPFPLPDTDIPTSLALAARAVLHPVTLKHKPDHSGFAWCRTRRLCLYQPLRVYFGGINGEIPVWALRTGSHRGLRRDVRAAHDLGPGQRLLPLSSLPQSHQRRHF